VNKKEIPFEPEGKVSALLGSVSVGLQTDTQKGITCKTPVVKTCKISAV
jgi:hypothetical protein